MTTDTPRLVWGHINLNVADLDRSRAFYALLGFTEYKPGIPYLGLEADAPRPLAPAAAGALGLAEGTRARACILELGGGDPKLDLTELPDLAGRPPLDTADRGLVRLCLGTRDLDALHARLAARGVDFVAPPATTAGARLALCRDPDGALIELIQLMPR